MRQAADGHRCNAAVPKSRAADAAEDAIRNYTAFVRAVQRGDHGLAYGHRRAAIESELDLLFALGAGEGVDKPG